MAIQKSIDTAYGLTAPEAYIRIAGFSGNKTSLRAQLEIFFNVTARNEGKRPIAMDMVQLEIVDGATLAQQYTALKALPAYSGAVDC